MTGRVMVLPYKMGSESATNLAKGLGLLQIKPDETSKFVSRPEDVIINWGNSSHVPRAKRNSLPTVLNPQNRVAIAVDKLKTFQVLEGNGVSVPQFRTTRDSAEKMMHQLNLKRVFCRTLLNAHSGEGIVIAGKPTELVKAPLYVEGIAKDREFRVHVLNNKVIDYAEKLRRNGAKETEEYNSAIRSVHNGWVYARENVQLPKEVRDQAIKAVLSLGLDFGAVDICTQLKTNQPFVLEVNTSPGLEGTTLDRYVNGFKELLNGYNG